MHTMTDPKQREYYRHFAQIPTRWADNDMYGHVNNVTYYAYFDTVVNRLLIERGWLKPMSDSSIAVVAETQCRFVASVAFPDVLEIGLSVARLGRSSVTYHLGVFRQGETQIAALGQFVHVYVSAASRLPIAIPEAVRQGLQALTITP